MSGPSVLVLDAGTSGFRASVYDLEGERLASREASWTMRVDPAAAPFGKLYDADAMWSAVHTATQAVLAATDASAVRAIAVTGQRIACAFLDAAGETLYLGPNADVRAFAGADLSDLDADAIYARYARFPPWMYAPARLRWFESAQPEVHARIARVVSLAGWLRARLGARTHVIDATLGADLLAVDADGQRAPIDSRVDATAWPALVHATEAGETVDAWGLKDVVVSAGVADTQAALLGVDEPTDLLVGGGSAPLIRPSATRVHDPKRRLWVSPAIDGHALEVNLGEMGTMHAWLRQLLGLDSFEALDALAAEAPIGCRAMSAHLGPRAMDLRALNTARPAATWMPFGAAMDARPPGRAELARAYLESCAFAARAGREWLDAVCAPVGPMTIVGGMAQTVALPGMLAGTLDEPVRRGPADATARGAARLAAVAAGLVPDLAASAAMARGGETVEPADTDEYEEAYERWLDREEQLEEL